jgi:hypothetical protein
MRLTGLAGKVYVEEMTSVSFGANCAAKLAVLQEPLTNIPEQVFFLDLQLFGADNGLLAQNRYVFSHTANLAPLLAAPPTTLSLSSSEQSVTLTNTGETTALFVWLEEARDLNALGYTCFDDNYFCLLPGESQTVRVIWKDVPVGDRRLEISGWNTHIFSTDGES